MYGAMSRAERSVPPPGGNGTMSVIGRSGYAACAATLATAIRAAEQGLAPTRDGHGLSGGAHLGLAHLACRSRPARGSPSTGSSRRASTAKSAGSPSARTRSARASAALPAEGAQERRGAQAVRHRLADDPDRVRLQHDLGLRPAALAQLVQEVALDEAAVEQHHRQAVELAAGDRLVRGELVPGRDAQDHLLAPDLHLAPLRPHPPRLEHRKVDAAGVEQAADIVGAALDDRHRDARVSGMELRDHARKVLEAEHRRHAESRPGRYAARPCPQSR